MSVQITPSRCLKWAASVLALLICPAALRGLLAEGGGEDLHVHWQQVTEAQVKVDDKIPLTWNIYQPDKKAKKESNLILILLGHRYVLLDTKEKSAYEVPLAQLHVQGKDVDTDSLPEAARLLPSSDWTLRDVGPAELIELTLGDYGRMLSVILPHIPDIRVGIY